LQARQPRDAFEAARLECPDTMASDNIHRGPAPARRHIPKGTDFAVRTQAGTQTGLHGSAAAGSRSSAPDSSHRYTGARYIRASRSGVRSPHVAAVPRRRIARSHIARNHMAHSRIGHSRMTDNSDSRLYNSNEAEVGIVVPDRPRMDRDLRCVQIP
jgi:hypothetical protein